MPFASEKATSLPWPESWIASCQSQEKEKPWEPGELKHFENDDSSAWLCELGKSLCLSVVDSALKPSGPDYIEAQEACNIIAASEFVLALLGTARVSLPENAEQWVQQNRSLDASHLKSMAIEALDSVLSERSELTELWQETEDYKAWVSDVKQLQSAITAS